VPAEVSALLKSGRILLCMSGTKTKIREWRRYRRLTLVQLAERVGITHGQLSKVERDMRPWGQPLLEKLAEELGTDPASLLMRDPTDPEGIWSIWDQVPPTERPRALSILKAFTRTGT
jgi:transcriptional regulator with XRE-family HTH domain